MRSLREKNISRRRMYLLQMTLLQRYGALLGNAVTHIMPPPQHVVFHPEIENDPHKAYFKQRNDTVASIHETGHATWKEKAGYHKRRVNEVAMRHYKTIFGERLSARKSLNQETDVRVNCKLLS
jgi:hypothetical protein